MPDPSPKMPSSVTVPCRCGAYSIISVAHFGRLQTCKKCGSGYSVVWKRDAKSGKPVPLVVASAKPRRAKPAPPPESMIDLACNCGYKRKASREELKRMPTCPGCGSPMYLDRAARPNEAPSKPLLPYVQQSRYGKLNALPPRPPPRLTPPSFPAPRPPSSGSYPKPPSSSSLPKPPSSSSLEVPKAASETRITMSGRILVICAYCGDRIMVGAERAGGTVTCMRCATVLSIPASAAPVAPTPAPPPTPQPLEEAVFDVPPDAEVSEPDPSTSAPNPTPAFIEGPTLGCPCGAELDVRGASPGSVYSCEACGREVTMEKRRHPQTLSTMMLPIFKEPEVVVDAGGLDVFCACGEALLVSTRDLGHPVQCPGCSVLLEVQQTPQGLQVKPIGRIDEQNWSLQDFS